MKPIRREGMKRVPSWDAPYKAYVDRVYGIRHRLKDVVLRRIDAATSEHERMALARGFVTAMQTMGMEGSTDFQAFARMHFATHSSEDR